MNKTDEKMTTNAQQTILVSNDNGMGNCKVTYGFKGKYYQFDFPSRYKELSKHSVDTLAIDGKIYSFTEGRLAVEHGHQTKDHEIHEILLKKALYEVYKLTKVKNFDVVANYSLDSYKEDGGEKVSLRMSNIKTIKAKELYDEEVTLTINRMQCFPECLSGGVLVKLPLKDEDVVFIDIGTRNIQIIRVVKGVPRYEESKATTKGMSSIYRGVADITKTLSYGINDGIAVQMYLEQTKAGKLDKIDVIETKILDYLIENVFSELDKCLDEMQVSPLFTKYVFLGGGSDLLSRFLDAKFMKSKNSMPIYVDNPYYATSLGLFKKAERLYKYERHVDANAVSSKPKTRKTKKAETSNR
jgi:hypothetical protein